MHLTSDTKLPSLNYTACNLNLLIPSYCQVHQKKKKKICCDTLLFKISVICHPCSKQQIQFAICSILHNLELTDIFNFIFLCSLQPFGMWCS